MELNIVDNQSMTVIINAKKSQKFTSNNNDRSINIDNNNILDVYVCDLLCMRLSNRVLIITNDFFPHSHHS